MLPQSKNKTIAAFASANTAGSNSGTPAVLPFFLRSMDLERGERGIADSFIHARAQLSLSHQTRALKSPGVTCCATGPITLPPVNMPEMVPLLTGHVPF